MEHERSGGVMWEAIRLVLFSCIFVSALFGGVCQLSCSVFFYFLFVSLPSRWLKSG